MNTKHTLLSWLPLAVAVTLMSGLIYVSIHQNYRQSLNDPQVQIAEDITAGLSAGRTLNQFSQQVDMRNSLASFIIVYDDTGTVIAASGLLDGEPPKPPQGVLDFAREHGENRITWQPEENTRLAIVVRTFSHENGKGFVLVGRNMREVEGRIKAMGKKVLFGWAVTLAATLASSALPMAMPMLATLKNKLKKRDEEEKDDTQEKGESHSESL